MTTFSDLPLFRISDSDTSREGARNVQPRKGSQMHLLLNAYAQHSEVGLTDEDAGNVTYLSSNPRCGYWKRCSDLRNLGLITDTGKRRDSSNGCQMMVCVITDLGWQALSC